MSPNLYDLLDVPEDADAAEIRAAWKAAIADLDPTDRRFRAFNDAAGVLLDPEQRASYDAELAAAREEPEAPAEAVEPAEPEPESEPESEAEAEGEESPEPQRAGSWRARLDADPPQWALGALGVLAVLALAFAVWVATWPGTFGDPSPADVDEVRVDATSAIAAAEDIAPVVLSYGYETLDDDKARAGELMTPGYAEKQSALLEELRPEIEAQRTTVTAAVRGSAVSDLSDDGDQSEVMVMVDQLVQRNGVTQTELQSWVTLRLIRDDGQWLLEQMCTTDPECG
jgi:Mce-associated membrane protein